MSAPRVLIADADLLTRTGLRVTLESAGFEVVAEADDAEAAMAGAVAGAPDLALIAADMPGGGTALTRRLAEDHPRLRIVMLARTPDGDELVAAVLAGASGYIVSEAGQERLAQALRGVLAGETAVPRRLGEHLLGALRGRDARRAAVTAAAKRRLTDREWTVLELLAEGTPPTEIGRRLGISDVTVRRHAASVVAKLGVADRAAAIRLMSVHPAERGIG